MRPQFLIFVALFAAFLTQKGAWSASTSANFAINVTTAQTITSINLSNNTFPGGAASGTVVGSISVTMSPASPAFSGALSLTGTNASNFQIVGSNLVTNGADPTGTYNINIVATQTGVNGLPLVQAETITGTSASLAACPALTFTYDFTTGVCTSSPIGTCNPIIPGVTGGTTAQNDAAFQSFNSEAQRHTRPVEPGYAGGANGAGNPYADADKDNCIVLSIPAGKYQYTWNKFQQSIRHLLIKGAGSNLSNANPTVMQNTNSDGTYYDEVAAEKNYDYFGDPGPTLNYGYPINSVSAGATSITTATPGNAGNFHVDRWVLVMSYSQQWYGYSPNMRYYDYAKVLSADASTGVITLDSPLTFTHLSTRPTTTSYCPGGTEQGCPIGPAAVVPIDTPTKPVTEYESVSGIQVLGNPNWNVNGCPQLTCDGWQWTGIIDGAATDMSFANRIEVYHLRNFTLSNSQWAFDEADKIINDLEYINDNVTTTINHAGELLWHMSGGTLGQTAIGSRNAVLDGGLVINGMSSSNESGCVDDQCIGINLDDDWQTVRVTVNGVTFQGNKILGNHPISGPSQTVQKIDGIVVAATTGPNGLNTRLQVQQSLSTYGSPSERMVDLWGDGDTVWKNGSFISGAAITSVTGDANYIYVDVTGTTFTTGDTVWASRVNTVAVQNSAGENTGFSWSSSNISLGANIPNIVWSGNSGN